MTTADHSEFLRAVEPVVTLLGGILITPDDAVAGDQPVSWRGETVAWVRAGDLRGALDRMVDDVEREVGAPLADMSRSSKQIAVRLLDERGVFVLRGAVDDIAARMAVSRVTLYAYLNALTDQQH